MTIVVSGKKIQVPDKCTIAELITQEKMETPEYVKVALNDDFISPEEFETTTLCEEDIVEFLTFMGGGSHKTAEI